MIRLAGKPVVVGFPKASTVSRTGCWPNGTPATAEPGWVVKASAATEPMTMKELLLVGGALPLAAVAVRVFGPAWFRLKSLKWAMPPPSVERVSVPAKCSGAAAE